MKCIPFKDLFPNKLFNKIKLSKLNLDIIKSSREVIRLPRVLYVSGVFDLLVCQMPAF